MGKRGLVLAFVSVLCISLLVNGILFMEWNKEKEANTALNTKVTELSATNEQLNKTVAELEGAIAYPEQDGDEKDSKWQHSIWWQTAMLRGDSEKESAFDKLVEENPIDAYFREQKEPMTTVDFVEYYYLYENAWKDEMNAVYQNLLFQVKDPALQKQLMEAQENFVNSMQTNYDFVVSAFGAEGAYPMFGTNVWLLSAGAAQGYKERTIELLEWSYILDSSSDFTFDAADFQKKYDASDIRQKKLDDADSMQSQEQNPAGFRQNSRNDHNGGNQR